MDGHLYLALLLIAGIVVGWLGLEFKLRRHVARKTQEPILIDKDEEPQFSQQSFPLLDEPFDYEPALSSTDVLQPECQSTLPPKIYADNLLTISVFAKPSNQFASYDLLQAISATGMQFGEMNIFHYYQRNMQGKRISLFSLASATKPGSFDLDRMGSFSCIGLTFFMDMTHLQNPLQAYYLMINTAQHLAEDLEGELRADPKTPWSEEHFREYEQRIMQSQLTENI